MARDYGAEYEARNERAQEAGWESFYDMRQDRESAREMFGDLDREQLGEAAEFLRDFDEGMYDVGELRDIFDDYIGGDDQDFYDWLGELYDTTAG